MYLTQDSADSVDAEMTVFEKLIDEELSKIEIFGIFQNLG